VSKRLGLAALTVLTAALSVSVVLGEQVRSPDPAPYRKIPDLPDDAERHIVIKGQDRGPVFVYTGLLNITPDIDYETIVRLRPTHMRGPWLFSWGGSVAMARVLETMIKLRRQGATYQPVLFSRGPFRGKMRIREDEIDAYRRHIFLMVGYLHEMGAPVDYWEPWNEPRPGPYEGLSGEYFWQGTWDEFLAVWDAAYDAIREAHPEAKIVGPSYAYGIARNIDVFLEHCREKGQILDVLSWHENIQGGKADGFSHPDRAYENIMRIRGLVEAKYPDLGIEEYHIDEWGYMSKYTGPGTTIAFFHYFDLAGIDRAANTVWRPDDLVLDGLMEDPQTPRTVYWTWVEYARQRGGVRLVTETNDPLVVTLASRNDRRRQVHAIVARSIGYGTKPSFATRVEFEDLPMSGQAQVTILTLRGSGPLLGGDLAGLTTTTMVQVTDGRLSIIMDDLAENEARCMVIEPRGDAIYLEDFESASDGQLLLSAPLRWKRKSYIGGATNVKASSKTALTGLAMDGTTMPVNNLGVVYKPIDLEGAKAYRLSFQAIANTTAKAASNSSFGFADADGEPIVYWGMNFWKGNTWELAAPGKGKEQIGDPLVGQALDFDIVVDEDAGTFHGSVAHANGVFTTKTFKLGKAAIGSVFRMADARSPMTGDVDVDNIVVRRVPDQWSQRLTKIKERIAKQRLTGSTSNVYEREQHSHREATIKARAAAEAGHYRISCGAAVAFIDPAGHGWFAEQSYKPGAFGNVNGAMADRGQIAIGQTDNPQIYRTELWGQDAYRITVPNGKYALRLHWAETYGLGPGGRTFDVVVEGKTVLKDFDATREAGGVKKGVVKEIEVEVTDGVLDIEFPHKEGVTPMINGIEVIRE